ncbi:hypothetical protein [Streptomyces sp. NPDC046821]|uniref:hypothetical protein n=1 Tax=Streptomyces sp. NPDC046821 TaxID=3154702 RepID=UPI0033DD7075
MLSNTRRVVMAAAALLILLAGAWMSWSSARYVLFADGHERGTLTVAACADRTCTGAYAPLSPGSHARAKVVITRSFAEKRGVRVPVVLKPGTPEAIRTGAPGFFHAWVPLGGALLLASVLIAGGLRLRRWAWATAAAGVALLTAAFAALIS